MPGSAGTVGGPDQVKRSSLTLMWLAAVSLLVLLGPAADPVGAASRPSSHHTTRKAPSTGKPRAQHRRSSIDGFVPLSTGGFGDSQNDYSWTMAWFNGKLYVGTSRNNLCNATIVKKSAWVRSVTGCPLDATAYFNLDMRAQIWAFTPGPNTWQLVYESPMVNQFYNGHIVRLARDAGYRSMAVYTDKNGVTALYVGTTGFNDLAYVLRSVDGVHFDTTGTAGLGVKASSIRALTPFAGHLFMAPIGSGKNFFANFNRDEVLMSDDPASGKWTTASYIGFGDQANSQIYSMATFNGQLYAAISNNSGFQLWRTDAAGKPPYSWTAVIVEGAFRGADSPTATAMTVFDDKLYVGTAAATIGAEGTAAKAAELIEVNPDDSWNLVVGDARQTPEGFKAPLSGLSAGFGNLYNVYLWKLASYDGWLYAGTYDYSTFKLAAGSAALSTAGFDLWKSPDGVHWQKVSTTGFDNPYNYGVRSMEDTPFGLFLGTANPFSQAPDRLGGTEVWLLPAPDGLRHPHGMALDTSPCPMAHCSAGLDGNQNLSIPTNAAKQAWQYAQKSVVFSTALGCSTGRHIIVCSGTKVPVNNQYDLGYVFALDLKGHLLWDSRRLLNAFSGGGAPLLDSQDNVYVSDNNWIVSFTPEGVVRWQTPNPAKAVLVSLNLLSSGYLVGQAGLDAQGRGLIVTINPQTGAIADRVDLTDTVNGVPGEWGTSNTVSVVGNRLYTVTQFVPSSQSAANLPHYGRLYAVDVDADGHLHPVWSFPFQGPSGASPLAIAGSQGTTIYFDGTGTMVGAQQDVTLLAVRDAGSSASLLWSRDLTRDFNIPYPTTAPAPGIQATPAHDPRGGIWVWSEFDHRVMRFDEETGQTIEALDMANLTGDANAQPDGVSTIVPNGGKPVMIIGMLASPQRLNSVLAIDLTTHTVLWSIPVGIGVNIAPYGQFPLATASDGTTLMIVPISDGTVHGYALS